MWKKLMLVVTGKRPAIDMWYYIQGNYRYRLYYVKPKNEWVKKLLLRQHIEEQIRFRIEVMNEECYNNGCCIKCGCETTMLQMADKPCDAYCYPKMMDRKTWDRFRDKLETVKRELKAKNNVSNN